LQPKPWPAWLAQATVAALPAAFVLRAVRARLGTPGFRPRQVPRGTTRLEAEGYRVAALPEVARPRGQGETALAPLHTTRRREGRPGQTVPGGLQALRVFALVDNPGRLAMGQAARLPPLGAARSSSLEALRGLGAPTTGIPGAAVRGTPLRPPRGAPRVKQRRPPRLPLMSKPRPARRPPLLQHESRGELHAIRL
jgi:hypothetical protein